MQMFAYTIALITLLCLGCQNNPTQPQVGPSTVDSLREQPNSEPNKAKDNSPAALINKACRQRMLTQRIAKSYFAVSMNLEPKIYQEQLNKSISLFKEQQEELKANSPSPKISEKLLNIDKLWNKYEAIVLSKPERSAAEKVLSMSQELLQLCEESTADFCEYSSSLPNSVTDAFTHAEIAKLINQAGRQRMLCQRLSLYYLAYLWDVDTEQSVDEIPANLNEFSSNLTQLQNYKHNPEEVKPQYVDMLDEWKLVATSCLHLDKESRETAPKFLQNTEKVLTAMNKVTALYEKTFAMEPLLESGEAPTGN